MQPLTISITSNATEYREALLAWMGKFRKNVKETLREQGKLLALRLIAFTPPRTAAQGRDRVARDIRKIFYGVDDMAEFNDVSEGIRNKIVETVGGEPAVRIFAKKDGTVYGVDRRLYRPTASMEEMSEFHQQHRDSRGHVTNAGQYTRDIGRWKFLDVMAVPTDTLNEYIKMVQARVGRAKGGWASGALALGGKVPGWIAVHARTAGRFEDNTGADEPNLIFENDSEWAGGDDVGRVLRNAIAARTRDIYTSIKHAAHEAGKPLIAA